MSNFSRGFRLGTLIALLATSASSMAQAPAAAPGAAVQPAPAPMAAASGTRRVQATNNLKQIGLPVLHNCPDGGTSALQHGVSVLAYARVDGVGGVYSQRPGCTSPEAVKTK